MADLEIRPTMRFIRIGYLVVLILLGTAIYWWIEQPGTMSQAAMVVAGLLMLWPIERHLNRQRTCCRMEGDHLRYEHGLVTTTVKTIPLANIQDATVRRRLSQRLWGIGDLRIETAGQASAIEIFNVENPQQVADQILAAARKK